MRWLLSLQLALALVLVLLDLGPTLPQLLRPSQAPELDRPVSPGDQTRRYRPRRPAQPGPGVDPDMPRRLVTVADTVDGARVLRVRGAIEPGDGARVAEEVIARAPARVLLDSPGGSVFDALELGRAIREAGADTALEAGAVCLSACPYVFAGGVSRGVDEDARMGVHQHSFGESSVLPAFLAVEDVQRGQAEVLVHLARMGIDLRVMGPAMATPADEIYILTPAEMAEWDVVTE
ncbi:hypothetical protein JQC91_14155 [Jannaschia sp. Os4]|nr:hypothetical protein [Jannaschia sp. Os4]MBM2577446.1 hypothetical protein [Jannaschia sp. Os4]